MKIKILYKGICGIPDERLCLCYEELCRFIGLANKDGYCVIERPNGSLNLMRFDHINFCDEPQRLLCEENKRLQEESEEQ